MWSQSYYQTLNILETASTKEIKKAYRRLAVTLHPDKLQLGPGDDKSKAEYNFVRLAKAYEVLSDEKVKRKRYDFLLKNEGVLEYPDDLNYRWEWIDQKIGIAPMSHRQSGPQEKDRQSWTYEEAKEFFRKASEDDEWSWEKDTTWRDIRENPVAFLAILGTLTFAFFFPSLFKYFNQQHSSRGRISRDTLIQKSKSIPDKEFVKLPPQASGTKSLGRNIRLKRKELAQLLVDHLEELIFSCPKVKSDPSLFSEEMETTVLSPSLQEIRAEDLTESFTCEEIEHFCFQLKDQEIIDSYIQLLQPFLSSDPQTSEDSVELQVDIQGGLDLIEHITMIAEDQRSRKAKGSRDIQKDRSGAEDKNEEETSATQSVSHPAATLQEEGDEGNHISDPGSSIPNRTWTTKEISSLAKGVQKFPGGTRQRWEIITNYMNQQLAPREPFTKEECLQQYQRLRSSKGGKLTTTASATVISSQSDATDQPPKPSSAPTTFPVRASSTSRSEVIVERGEGPQQQWTNEQQKQLEAGLSTYPASLGLSQQERWRGIAEMVENKTATECLQRYKEIRESIKEKRSRK